MTQNKKKKIFLTRQDLIAMGISYSPSHLLFLEQQELFPRRVYLSPQKPVWLLEEIDSWIEKQSARRGDANHG